MNDRDEIWKGIQLILLWVALSFLVLMCDGEL